MRRVRAKLSSGLTLDKLHRDVLIAMDKALEAANPASIVRSRVKFDRDTLRLDNIAYLLNKYRRVFVIGAGKASGYMGEELEKRLGSRITSGLVIVPDYLRPWPKGRRIKYYSGTHPIPSQENVDGVVQMIELAKNASSNDLVILALSGGASALMDYPLQGITLSDERKTTDLLLKSGAKIQEVNTVRKHLSQVKGGRLAETLRNTRILTLIISDVVGDRLDAIGSGPTVPDPTTYEEAKQVLARYGIWSKTPARVRNVVELGRKGAIAETPKDDRFFGPVRNLVIGSNRESCYAATAYMKRRGYNSHVLSTHIVGEAREAGRILGSIATDMRNNEWFSPPGALVAGGETTVTVRGKGKGGRNQELALAAAIAIDGSENLVLGSFGTDGVDGPTDAAGALVDGITIEMGRRRGMDPEIFLENNDSYSYFSRLGSLLKTGPTGTNVNDVMILAAK